MWQEWAVYIVLTATLLLVIRRIFRSRKSGQESCTSCTECPECPLRNACKDPKKKR